MLLSMEVGERAVERVIQALVAACLAVSLFAVTVVSLSFAYAMTAGAAGSLT